MNSIFDLGILTLDSLERQIISLDTHGILDVERLGPDALEIKYRDKDSKNQTYILNVRSSLEQIWLSSPMSGPSHFRHQKDGWIDIKKRTLQGLLSNELSKILGIRLNFKSENFGIIAD
jgi:frataxin-like iron-binding protein CyaY